MTYFILLNYKQFPNLFIDLNLSQHYTQPYEFAVYISDRITDNTANTEHLSTFQIWEFNNTNNIMIGCKWSLYSVYQQITIMCVCFGKCIETNIKSRVWFI